MIKPGQIYRTNIKMGTRLHCITTKVVRGKCYTITHEGRGYLRWAEDFETNGTGVTKDEAQRNAVVNWNKMMKEITA